MSPRRLTAGFLALNEEMRGSNPAGGISKSKTIHKVLWMAFPWHHENGGSMNPSEYDGSVEEAIFGMVFAILVLATTLWVLF